MSTTSTTKVKDVLTTGEVARALNAASGTRPVVILANLSGFDGSPESMRKLQLEYGAEIGRAVVNFKGPERTHVLSLWIIPPR